MGFSGNVGAEFIGGNYGIIGRSSSVPLLLVDDSRARVALFSVDGQGNVAIKGNLTSLLRTAGGAMVSAFSPKTTLPTVEDNGTAQLVGGAVAVRFEPSFAASIDPAIPYRVFLTPDGDTRGLFVAAKTPNGFIVRETQSGRS